MSQEQIKQARQVRKRRMQERQAVIFGLLVLVLAGIVLAAVGVYTGAISSPFAREFSYEEKPVDAQEPVPCLPTDTLPVPSSSIKVQVLNASDRGGLAAVVAEALEDRNFEVIKTGNAQENRASVAIRFGIEGVAQGYTLGAHFPSAALILDEREDSSVDVELGQYFAELIPVDDVGLDSETPMLAREGCTDLWELSSLVDPPEAPETEDGEENNGDTEDNEAPSSDEDSPKDEE